MALISCPECGKDVTDTVKKCIHCGYLIKAHKRSISFRKVSIIVTIIVIVLGGIGFFLLNNRLNDEEKVEVDRVEMAIAVIGDVEINSKFKIIEAEMLYDALSEKCKRHVENREELIEARKIYDKLEVEETIKLITEIGEITLANQTSIDKAKKSYDSLSDKQRELVENSEELLAAVEQLADIRAEDVDSKITKIGTITLNSEDEVLEARKAYDALSENEKNRVTNYEVLVAAEEQYVELLINNCIDLINNIGLITLDSKKNIDNAQSAYNALSKESKEKITNYSMLVSANNEYKRLVHEEEERKKILNIGDIFSTSKWEITYKKANISAKILPNSTSGFYSYYYAEDDETFIDLVFQIKNIDTDILGIEELISDCRVEYDGSLLSKSYRLFVSSGSDIDKIYSWDGLDALESTTLHVAIVMPRELQSNEESITVKIMIAGEEKIINVR